MTSALTRACRKAVRPVRQRFFPAPIDLTSARGRELLTVLAPRPLVLIAHPDDETFCSGLICHLADAHDAEITIACATRGEGGIPGNPGIAPDELGQIRSMELKNAAAELGVSVTTFLGFADPVGEKPAFEDSHSELFDALHGVIASAIPSVIITHGSSGEYWHPAHTALHAAAISQASPIPVLTFNAWQSSHPLSHLLNKDDAAHIVLDTESYAEARLRALAHHRSQAGVFESFAGGSLSDFISQSRFEGYRLCGKKLRT